jgi:CheY-like chemotaxis protein/HPt (histidine-containing phosphotransfer) domain-containing protein
MAAAANKLSVLVIDDDMLMRELLAALFEAEEQPCTTAETQREAVNILSGRDKPDVVLTDLHLPGTDISQLIASVRDLLVPGALLLGMSGSEPETGVRNLLDGFLLKPFSTEEFYEVVKQATAPETTIEQNTQAALEDGPPVLDLSIYKRLSVSLPTAKLHELYEITLQDTAHRIGLIHTAAIAGDITTCRGEAHAIKGGCGMVGAMQLRALAMGIETGDVPDTATLHQMVSGCDRLRGMLATLS